MSPNSTTPFNPNITALIAEDEPLLAQALRTELAAAWPALQIVATVGDGISAVTQTLLLKPSLLFFDVRMPGLDGLDAAADIADQWPADEPLPVLVFVTAYHQYAVQAFERQAVDYLLKPVQAARLVQCVARIMPICEARYAHYAPKSVVPKNSVSSLSLNDAVHQQLRQLLGQSLTEPSLAQSAMPAGNAPQRLVRIQASVGNSIHMVAIDDVLYFEAADKYVRVITADKEYLIRTPIKDLLPQLDEGVFWQIHRSTVVRASAITQVLRDDAGKNSLLLQGRAERLAVSRLYAHIFKAM